MEHVIWQTAKEDEDYTPDMSKDWNFRQFIETGI